MALGSIGSALASSVQKKIAAATNAANSYASSYGYSSGGSSYSSGYSSGGSSSSGGSTGSSLSSIIASKSNTSYDDLPEAEVEEISNADTGGDGWFYQTSGTGDSSGNSGGSSDNDGWFYQSSGASDSGTNNSYGNSGTNYEPSGSTGSAKTTQQTNQQTQSVSDAVDTASQNETVSNDTSKQSNDFARAMLGQTAAQDNSSGNQKTVLPGLDKIFDENAIQRSIRQTIDEINAQNNASANTNANTDINSVLDWNWRNENNNVTANEKASAGNMTAPAHATRSAADLESQWFGNNSNSSPSLMDRIMNIGVTPAYGESDIPKDFGGIDPTQTNTPWYENFQLNPPILTGQNNSTSNGYVPTSMLREDGHPLDAKANLNDIVNINGVEKSLNDVINSSGMPLSNTEAIRYSVQDSMQRQDEARELYNDLYSMIYNNALNEGSTPEAADQYAKQAAYGQVEYYTGLNLDVQPTDNNPTLSDVVGFQNGTYNMGTSQSTGDLQLQNDIRNGKTTYDDIYRAYYADHVGSMYNRYLNMGYSNADAELKAKETAMRQAYQRIYDLGYRPDLSSDESAKKYAVPGLETFVDNLEKATGNNYYTNAVSFDDRLVNMISGGIDGRDDRLFYDLTSELAGNAYLNQKNGTNYGTTPKVLNENNINDPSSWNGALQAAMSGQLTKDEILHFYDSKDSDLVIPEVTRKWLASDSSHALQQMFLNNGKNIDRLETVNGSQEEFREAWEAFIEANPALKLMYENNVLSYKDILANFFKNSDLSGSDDEENSKSYSRYGSGYSRSRSGGGGGGGGGGGSYSSSGSSSSSSASTKTQSQSRIHNIMKNWTF